MIKRCKLWATHIMPGNVENGPVHSLHCLRYRLARPFYLPAPHLSQIQHLESVSTFYHKKINKPKPVKAALRTRQSQLPATRNVCGTLGGENSRADTVSSGGEVTSRSLLGLTPAPPSWLNILFDKYLSHK